MIKMSRSEFERYMDELADLKVNKRKEVSTKIKQAREQNTFFNLADNEQYMLAKKEQKEIESRIAELQRLKKNVLLTDADDLERVIRGCRVQLYNPEYDEIEEYTLVSDKDPNSLKGTISEFSPLGKALLFKKKGDIVSVKVRACVVRYEILKIMEEKSFHL